MEHLTHFFFGLIDHYGYFGLFVVMVLGNMGLPVGAEFIVPSAGALAATGHLSSVWIAALVATAGEVVGGLILYTIGWYGGKPFVVRYGRYIKLTEDKFEKWHVFYQKHGNILIFICRFLPLIRGFAALPAGVSRMPKRYFVTYTAAGSFIFCFALTYLGSIMGRHQAEMMATIHKFATVLIGLVVLAIVAALVRWYLVSRTRTA